MSPDQVAWADLNARIPTLTYRRFDFWATQGWIHTTNPGSGFSRTVTNAEVAVIELIVQLTAAGLTPSAAAPLARQLADVDVATLGPFHVSRAAS